MESSCSDSRLLQPQTKGACGSADDAQSERSCRQSLRKPDLITEAMRWRTSARFRKTSRFLMMFALLPRDCLEALAALQATRYIRPTLWETLSASSIIFLQRRLNYPLDPDLSGRTSSLRLSDSE